MISGKFLSNKQMLNFRDILIHVKKHFGRIRQNLFHKRNQSSTGEETMNTCRQTCFCHESASTKWIMKLTVFNLRLLWSGDSGNWIEIAYGTSSGTVRVIVQHPETVGSGPQLFQTFSVHRSPVTKIMLSEKHLISGTAMTSWCHHADLMMSPRRPHDVTCSSVSPVSASLTLCVCCVSVCADNNHVRTWTVTRFRGMISTQPGSTPLTSFKILSLDDVDGHGGCSAGTEIGEDSFDWFIDEVRLLLSDSVTPCSLEEVLLGWCHRGQRSPGQRSHADCLLCSGPYGERDDQQVFIQRVVPDTDKLYVRLSSNGKRWDMERGGLHVDRVTDWVQSDVEINI